MSSRHLSITFPALGPLILALVISVLGGAAFAWLALPLPWMLGAATAAMVAALAGAPVAIPGRLRSLMMVVLGVLLGSSFTLEVVQGAGQWLPSLAGILVYVLTIGILVFALFVRIAGYDPVTAYFAGTPGGLSEMTLVGTAMGGDERTIALTHSVRIVIIVFLVAFGFRLLAGYTPMGGVGRAYVPVAEVPPVDLLLLAGCGALGALLGRALRLPAGVLIGPLVLSALVHLTGLSSSSPPTVLVAAAQVVVGGAIGCRFAGTSLHTLLRVSTTAALSSLMMLIATLSFAGVLTPLVGLSFPALVLAFAPGGLVEMAVIALALGIDTAFVTTHNVFRVLAIVVSAPLVFRLFARRARQLPD